MTVINKTDSMKQIQEKLNKKGEILFTKGTYKITKQLIISEGTVINLNGSTLQRKANIQSIFLNKVTTKTKAYNGDGDIIIKNGAFEGMGGYGYDNLLTFFHSHDIKIENVEFRDSLCHAIEINSSQNVLVTNCKFFGYNLKDSTNAYKELIQLDYAGFAAFVLSGSTRDSACYDGTCCNHINILGCVFSKSNYRDYPYACIGEHAQFNNRNKKHQYINIQNNEFHCKLNPNLIQACISMISMENVCIIDNTFETNRVARIYSKDFSYNSRGEKVASKDGEGICKDISIKNNTIIGCKTNKEAFQIYNKSGSVNHSGIKKSNNVMYLSK